MARKIDLEHLLKSRKSIVVDKLVRNETSIDTRFQIGEKSTLQKKADALVSFELECTFKTAQTAAFST